MIFCILKVCPLPRLHYSLDPTNMSFSPGPQALRRHQEDRCVRSSLPSSPASLLISFPPSTASSSPSPSLLKSCSSASSPISVREVLAAASTSTLETSASSSAPRPVASTPPSLKATSPVPSSTRRSCSARTSRTLVFLSSFVLTVPTDSFLVLCSHPTGFGTARAGGEVPSSIAAVVASTDGACMKYAAQIREQEGRKEFITDLKGAFGSFPSSPAPSSQFPSLPLSPTLLHTHPLIPQR